jgi:hypothetical protein
MCCAFSTRKVNSLLMKRHEQALNHSKSAIMIVQESLLKAFLPKIENQEEDKKL